MRSGSVDWSMTVSVFEDSTQLWGCARGRELWQCLRAAQGDQRDFRWDAEAHGGADCAESAIDVEDGKRRLRVARARRFVARRIVYVFKCADIRSGHGERPEVRTRNVVRNKARGTQAMVENLHLDLAAV